jgi:hypothetical protein
MFERSMPENLWFFLKFMVLILIFGCSSKISETRSVWLKSDINIDGSLGDWEGIPLVSSDDNGIFNFKLCNDNDYLFAVFYSRNLRLAGQIKMMGIKLWVDSTGGKNKKIGLFFRGGPAFSEMRDSTLPGKHFRDEKMNFSGEDDPIEREKFAVINNDGDVDFISKDGSNGPAIGYGISNGTLVYELRIPLRVKRLEGFAVGADPGDIVSLCLELSGGGKPEGMRGERPEGGPPGGINMINEQVGGGMPPGGGRGMPGGPPPGERGKSQEMWIKIHLASKPEIPK